MASFFSVQMCRRRRPCPRPSRTKCVSAATTSPWPPLFPPALFRRWTGWPAVPDPNHNHISTTTHRFTAEPRRVLHPTPPDSPIPSPSARTWPKSRRPIFAMAAVEIPGGLSRCCRIWRTMRLLWIMGTTFVNNRRLGRLTRRRVPCCSRICTGRRPHRLRITPLLRRARWISNTKVVVLYWDSCML